MINSAYGQLYQQSVRRRVFFSYCHGDDQEWYDLASAEFCDWLEAFTDRSLDEPVRSNDSEYVNRRIREDRIVGSSVTIVLCGARTYGRKYVDWEIRSTLHHCHGLVAIALPSARIEDGKYIVPRRLNANIQSGYAVWMGEWTWDLATWKWAVEEAYNRSTSLADQIDNSLPMLSRNTA